MMRYRLHSGVPEKNDCVGYIVLVLAEFARAYAYKLVDADERIVRAAWLLDALTGCKGTYNE